MLGCQDFCGYYEWTFDYLRRKYGTSAIETFWREAIAKDSQSHYIAAGQQKRLRGLYEAWSQTGESEQCDWTVLIDESRNHLRMDMRKCPSKGFLITNDLNADEDYCDHCIGWIGPALEIIGAEVVAHEHNHCGQCWWRIRMTSSPSSEGELPADIRHDPSWEAGFIDRFEHHQRVEVGDLLADEFTNDPQLLIIGDGGLTSTSTQTVGLLPHSIVTDRGYLTLDFTASQPRCILLGTDINTVRQVADRWNRVPSETRPLLAHPYFPSTCPVRFAEVVLPRPLPILPLLISKRLYTHQPRAAHPTTNELLILLAVALANEVLVSGIDQEEIRMIRQKHERLDFNELGIDA